MTEIDREVANWWTSTNPNAKFAQNLFCARVLPNGERLGIINDRLIRRKGQEVIEERKIENADQLLVVLRDEMGLDFPTGTRFGHGERPWPTA